MDVTTTVRRFTILCVLVACRSIAKVVEVAFTQLLLLGSILSSGFDLIVQRKFRSGRKVLYIVGQVSGRRQRLSAH